MEPIILAKDVFLFKNVLKDPKSVTDFIRKQKEIKEDKWFGQWQDWRPWGEYAKAYPADDDSFLNDTSEGAELLRECLDVFWDILSVYKKDHLNKEYFDSLGLNYDFPTSYQELISNRTRPNVWDRWGIADVVVLESTDTSAEKNLSMEYHQDRRPWFGGSPHIFNCNIYINDDYEGGEIIFADLETAEKATTIYEGKEMEYFLIDRPIEYKMEAGDALIFRTDRFHAVKPVKGNKFYIRQFLSSAWSKDFVDARDSMDPESFKEFLKIKEKEGFAAKKFEMRVYENESEISNVMPGQNICVIRPGQ